MTICKLFYFFPTDSRFPLTLGLYLMIVAALASIFNQDKLSTNLAVYAYFFLLAGAFVQILGLQFKITRILKREAILIFIMSLFWLIVFINFGWLNLQI